MTMNHLVKVSFDADTAIEKAKAVECVENIIDTYTDVKVIKISFTTEKNSKIYGDARWIDFEIAFDWTDEDEPEFNKVMADIKKCESLADIDIA